MTKHAPRRAQETAICLPMPDEAPVTKMVLPSSEKARCAALLMRRCPSVQKNRHQE
ncbi:hypothetical protein XMIN_676 [Xanthomonas citri pv. mangiferaeindicae LMG 941]|nr:hypothetical protein XMIN_676 [Xanthomonas citri pv. mangiferaeindicae LMG 941]